jgi:hypothetical protein
LAAAIVHRSSPLSLKIFFVFQKLWADEFSQGPCGSLGGGGAYISVTRADIDALVVSNNIFDATTSGLISSF